MLLKSASTPILGSLLPSFSESPSNNPSYHYEAKQNSAVQYSHAKLSFHQTGPLNLITLSSNSSPISPSIDRFSNKGIRRAQSDGNLAGMASEATSGGNDDQFFRSHTPNTFVKRPKCLMLETIPSFSFYKSNGVAEDDIEEEEEEEEEDEDDIDIYYEEDEEEEDEVMAIECAGFGVKGNVNLVEGVSRNSVGRDRNYEMAGRGLYGGKELEVGGDGGKGGEGGFGSFGGGGDGGEKPGVEEYYKRMVEENPGNALFLGNYAQFLYQSKGDLKRAEEYYSRAILADPVDGENLSQYAKLVWQLHRDEDRATSYYERAVQASPQASHIHAAYANFLWQIEDDEEEIGIQDVHASQAYSH